MFIIFLLCHYFWRITLLCIELWHFFSFTTLIWHPTAFWLLLFFIWNQLLFFQLLPCTWWDIFLVFQDFLYFWTACFTVICLGLKVFMLIFLGFCCNSWLCRLTIFTSHYFFKCYFCLFIISFSRTPITCVLCVVPQFSEVLFKLFNYFSLCSSE